MKSDLISVIVPIYNIEDYISPCIDSIINQTYKNLEIILVNDGSTDKCSEICNKYAENDNRIIVLNKKNGGLSDARNAGIERASGAYIAFVDGDDWIEDTMYEKLYHSITKYNADVAFGITERETRKYFENKHFDNDIVLRGKEILDAYICPEHVPHILKAAWDKLYTRKVIGDIRFPLGKHGEDGPFNTLIMSNTKICVFVPEIVYHYRDVRPGNISSNNIISTRLFSDRIPIALEQIEVLKSVGRVDLARRQENVYINEILNYFCQVNGSKDNKEVYGKSMNDVIKEAQSLMKDILFRRKVNYKLRLKILVFKTSRKLFLEIFNKS